MPRKKKQIIVLAALLVICVAAYLGIKAYNESGAEQKGIAQEADRIRLCNLGTITDLAWYNDKDNFSFKLEDDLWRYLPDKDFPLDQNKFESIVSTLAYLTAVRSFEPSESLASYGLDQPSWTVTATDSDGKSITLLIGGRTESGDVVNYYVTEQNGKLVHTISANFVNYLDGSLLDLVELETFPTLSEEHIESIQLESSDRSLRLEKEVKSSSSAGKDKTGETEEEGGDRTDNYSWYLVQGGTRTALADLSPTSAAEAGAEGKSTQELLNNLLSQLSLLAFESCADYQANKQARIEYGLDNPTISLKVTFADPEGVKQASSTFTLTVGSLNQEGNAYYAVKDNSVRVNLINSQTVETFEKMLSAF
ncbi:MAG: DUF4340 domain-containing protein [Peptococcaceae bacterium]|nr:DUF4340 domain-containing protein [Peptococcaceae bacterium]